MRKFASILSIPILVVPLILITFWLLQGSHVTSFKWFLVFLLNLVFLPTMAVFWLRSRNFISDVDLRDKQERLVFMGLVLFLSLTNYFDAVILSAPGLITALNFLVFTQILFMTAITFIWKISGHLLVLTSIATVAYMVKGDQALALFLILPPVALHRFFLKHHTPAQIVAGAALGFSVTYIVLRTAGF